MIAKYDFQDLVVEKAAKLSQKLGFDTIVTTSMPLSAIYNQDDQDFHKTRKLNPIGFQARNVG